MSNHNYTKYSKKNSNSTNIGEIEESSIITNVSEIDETLTSNRIEHETVLDEINDHITLNNVNNVPETEANSENSDEYIVSNCKRLNVRTAPTTDSDVICIIRSGTSLKVDFQESNDNWYKVCTSSGVEGYCMRDYVTKI